MKRLAQLLFTLAPLIVKPLHAAERPNILSIFCDDLTNQALSCLGDSRKLLETPNIDRLAAQGMKFTRCLVPNSICGPSRATVLTGKYSHMNGFYSNVAGRPFDGAQQRPPAERGVTQRSRVFPARSTVETGPSEASVT